MDLGAGRSELRDDLGGDQFEVIEIGEVEGLQVHASRADGPEAADFVDQFGGTSRGPVLAEFGDVAADGGGASGDVLLGAAAAQDECVGVDEGVGVTVGGSAGGADASELRFGVGQ
ncbi:hypothetical protein RhoFasGS6_03742 [Rhodococcus fascians]|nr:hypothetical protein [Rhodococcus fascians]